MTTYYPTEQLLINHCSYTTNSANGTILGKPFDLRLTQTDDTWHLVVQDPEPTHLWGYKSSQSVNNNLEDFLFLLLQYYSVGAPYPSWIKEGEQP